MIMSKHGELIKCGYRFDHSATERGYISRKIECKVVPYVGRFGIGVKVLYPRCDSTQYVYNGYYVLDSGVLIVKNKYNGQEERVNYDSFKNRKKSYIITINGYTREFSKDEYDVTLERWNDLCN